MIYWTSSFFRSTDFIGLLEVFGLAYFVGLSDFWGYWIVWFCDIRLLEFIFVLFWIWFDLFDYQNLSKSLNFMIFFILGTMGFIKFNSCSTGFVTSFSLVIKSIVESNGFLFEPVHRRSLSNLQGSADLRKNHPNFPSTDLALRGRAENLT